MHARWLLLGAAGIVLVAHSLAYNFVTDDAYISFVYSRNFAEHGELAFNLGDAVEGYTNFSWTVLIGVLMKLGISPELSSRVLGTLCALATLYVVMRAVERGLGRKTAWAAVPSLILACSSGFACWTSGGLETQLFTLLVAAALEAVVAAVERPAALRRAAVCLALAAMTRPEGPVVAAVLGAVWVLHRVLERRAAGMIVVTPPTPRVDRRLLRLAIASAVICGAFVIGLIGLVGQLGAFEAGLGAPFILVLVAVVLALGFAVVGLRDCLRLGTGRVSSLWSLGRSLGALGGITMIVAIRRGAACGDVITWNRAVPCALAAIALAAMALGTSIAATWRPWPRLREELLAALWFLGLWAPWFLWRWWYYGYPFPNTYYVKAAGPWTSPDHASTMLSNGLYYVWQWLQQTRLIFASPLLLLGLVAIRTRTPRFVLAVSCGLLLAVYLAYTVTVGGDFMGLHRFIMPLFVLAAILVVLGCEWLAHRLPREEVVFPGSLPSLAALLALSGALVTFAIVVLPGAGSLTVHDPRLWVPVATILGGTAMLAIGRLSRDGLSMAAATLLVGAFATTQVELTHHSLDPKNLTADHGIIDTPAFLIVYTEDRAKIGRAMADCFTDDDFSIVGGAGAQPYYGRMRGIDVFGLVSDKIAHREPRSRPRAGHTKWGTDPLLAEYKPDFVFSCYRIDRAPNGPPLPCSSYWLGRGFEEVTVRIPGMLEHGEYYTFLAAKARNFKCPNRIR